MQAQLTPNQLALFNLWNNFLLPQQCYFILQFTPNQQALFALWNIFLLPQTKNPIKPMKKILSILVMAMILPLLNPSFAQSTITPDSVCAGSSNKIYDVD